MTTSTRSTPQPTALPPTLSPDSIDTLPVLSAVLSRLQTPSTSSAASPPATADALSLKDFPTATDEIKHKLQRARVQVKELPDIDRGIAEQEEEISELEEKIQKQREVLEGLGAWGERAQAERQGRDRVMET